MAAKLVLIATLAGVVLYVFIQGAEKFYVESMGTLVLSPLIYIRLAPAPIHDWLLRASNPAVCLALCLVPVGMLLGAVGCGISAYRRNSLPLALAAFSTTAVIFGVYHAVKHLGFTVVQ